MSSAKPVYKLSYFELTLFYIQNLPVVYFP